jgi:hypothetical protein
LRWGHSARPQAVSVLSPQSTVTLTHSVWRSEALSVSPFLARWQTWSARRHRRRTTGWRYVAGWGLRWHGLHRSPLPSSMHDLQLLSSLVPRGASDGCGGLTHCAVLRAVACECLEVVPPAGQLAHVCSCSKLDSLQSFDAPPFSDIPTHSPPAIAPAPPPTAERPRPRELQYRHIFHPGGWDT